MNLPVPFTSSKYVDSVVVPKSNLPDAVKVIACVQVIAAPADGADGALNQ